MGRKEQKYYYPPLENRKRRFWSTFSRVTINIFGSAGLMVLVYFAIFSILDTPAERRMRNTNQALKKEYEALEARLEEVEKVLGNVTDRDASIFLTLFEANPYEIAGGTQKYQWQRREELMDKTNNELAVILDGMMGNLGSRIRQTEKALSKTYADMMDLEEGVNGIPSVQPVINNELTLLTASFGQRIQPYYKVLTMHNGVDYTVPEGTRVFATADGTVKTATSRPSTTGNTIVIDHGNGYETHYNHLSRMSVKQGQRVRRGDIIALTGDTGLSLMPHLHYEIHYEGAPIDPIHYFFAELDPRQYDRIIQIAGSGMQSFD